MNFWSSRSKVAPAKVRVVSVMMGGLSGAECEVGEMGSGWTGEVTMGSAWSDETELGSS